MKVFLLIIVLANTGEVRKEIRGPFTSMPACQIELETLSKRITRHGDIGTPVDYGLACAKVISTHRKDA